MTRDKHSISHQEILRYYASIHGLLLSSVRIQIINTRQARVLRCAFRVPCRAVPCRAPMNQDANGDGKSVICSRKGLEKITNHPITIFYIIFTLLLRGLEF